MQWRILIGCQWFYTSSAGEKKCFESDGCGVDFIIFIELEWLKTV